MILGILGGGQLAYMLCENIQKKIFDVVDKIYVFSDKIDMSCQILKNEEKINFVYGKYNYENIFEFSKKCDVLTYEFENIDINILKKIEKPIYPDIKYLEIIQDKFIQKEFLKNNKLNVSPYSNIHNLNDITGFIKIYNYPVIIKCRRGSFDGRGNTVIKNKEDLDTWLEKSNNFQHYYIEDYLNFEKNFLFHLGIAE